MIGRWLPVLLLTSSSLALAQDTASNAPPSVAPSAASSAAAPAPAASQDPANSGAAPADRAWIARSNEYANLLIDIEKKYSPESASAEGLSLYDQLISVPTLAAQIAADAEEKAALDTIEQQIPKEKNKYVKQDLEIMAHAVKLDLRRDNFNEAHVVPYFNATSFVYGGARTLLDDQVAAERRQATVVRLTKYAGLAPGTKPLTDILKERIQAQMAKPGMIYPSKTLIDTSLSRNQLYIDGIADLCKQYKLTGWEEPYAKLKTQLADYDQWVKTELLPKARTDFRQPPELYAMSLEGFGIDIPPAQLSEMAHKSFLEYQAEMQVIAAQIAKKNGWPSGDYREVIKKLKEQQLIGEEILPFYQKRLKEIEGIIVTDKLVTLPNREARIRIGTPAESAQQPAPHMIPPPLLNNHGEQGEFVLPLNMPAGAGTATAAKVDDYTYDAASWTLIAHEARPGHELQFDSMVEHGISLARSRYAFNSTNVEGWGLYAEYITKPYMPLEGQLISLQFRLLRAARAYLDPELQAGKIDPKEAMRVLTEDCVFSVPFANQEVERYTFRMPGQANSYYYGYTKLLQLRKDTEAALGKKFDAKAFHDFILSQGLLPPDQMRKAVMDDFIPKQKSASANGVGNQTPNNPPSATGTM